MTNEFLYKYLKTNSSETNLWSFCGRIIWAQDETWDETHMITNHLFQNFWCCFQATYRSEIVFVSNNKTEWMDTTFHFIPFTLKWSLSFWSKDRVANSLFDYANLYGFSKWRFRKREPWPWSYAATLRINLLLNRNNLTNKDFVQVVNVFRMLYFFNSFNWDAIMFNSLCILNSTVDMGVLNFKEIWQTRLDINLEDSGDQNTRLV